MPRIKLDPFENVGNGREAVMITENIWPNTLEQIILQFSTSGPGVFTKAHITELRVKFGSKIVWDVTGAQLAAMNLFEVINEGVTVLTLPWYNQRARNLAQAYLACPDFQALAVRKVQVSLKIAGATDPFKIDAWADVVSPGLLSPAGRLVFRQLLRQQLTPSAAEVDKPQSINIGQARGARLRRLHFFSPLVTDITVKRDGLEFFEKVPLVLQNELLKNKGWVPQSNTYSYVADEDDNADKTLTTIRDDKSGGSLIPQQILMTTSGAGAFDVVADVIAGLDG